MSQGYGPDLRIIIGWLFVIFGAILAGYGLVRPDASAPLTHTNVNLQWGAVLLVFGVVMLVLGYLGNRRSKAEDARAQDTGSQR
jgi:multisubunit Na+/H+ antiporter MnhG subunit